MWKQQCCVKLSSHRITAVMCFMNNSGRLTSLVLDRSQLNIIGTSQTCLRCAGQRLSAVMSCDERGGALWVCAIRQEEQQKGRQAPRYLWGFPWCVCPVFVCKQVFVCNLLISMWSKWVFITCGLLIQHHGYDGCKRGTAAPQWPQLHKQLLICDCFFFFYRNKALYFF